MLPPLERSIDFDRTRVEIWSIKVPQTESFADRLSARSQSRKAPASEQQSAAEDTAQRALAKQAKPDVAVVPTPDNTITPVWTLETVEAAAEPETTWVEATATIDAGEVVASVPTRGGRMRLDVANLYARADTLGRPDELAVGALLDARA